MSSENQKESSEEDKKKEAITSIESIDAGPEQKAQLILVLLGLKPAAELALYPWNSSPENVEAFLDRSGLQYARRKSNKQGKTVAEYAVSKDERLVDRLLNCDSSAEYGALMGYPESAVQAFEAKEVYEGPLPEDIENSIFKMKFSKDLFEKEFETVRRWNKALSEYAPNLSPR